MSTPQDFMEVFLQEASEHLQFLREYSGILQDSYPVPEDVERLYISAHSLAGTSATYGFALFSEVSGKLAHIFQYAMNATIGQDAAGPLVEFISEAIAVLETDLLMISANNAEAVEDIAAFKERYPFAFPSAKAEDREEDSVVELATEGQHTDMGGEPAAQGSVAVVEASAGEGACRSENLPEDGEVPDEILEFFVPEAEEHLQIVQECLLALEANPNAEDIHRLFRAMHTVKGSAAQVGLQRISRVAHRAEDLIGRLRDGELQPSAEIVDICLESVDALKKFLYRQWADEPTMQAAVKSLLGRIARLAPEELEATTANKAQTLGAGEDSEPTSAKTAQMWGTSEGVSEPTSANSAQTWGTRAEASETTSAGTGQIGGTKAAEEDIELEAEALVAGAKKDPTATPQSKSVRIALERLDRMMNAVGELVINRTRMLGRLGELQNLTDVLNFSKARMSDKVGEFQEKYEFSRIGTTPSMPAARPVADEQSFGGIKFPFAGGYSSYSHGFDHSLAEFSELEMDRYDEFSILSRSLTEISADITEVLTQLDGFVRRVDSDIDEFTKLAHRLQDEITQARMVPIGNLYTRISRTVRDAAKATNKQVEVTFEGAETELDNNIIQQIADPLLHLVRNSVAHGIERTEERYNSGKSDVGKVVVRAYHRGNHIYIEVEDDGRGIDYDRVRQTAVESGLTRADESDRLSERDLLGLLFHPGFSTAPRKTELAGRGVGLDVVRSNIAALNGEIEVESQKGFGSRFTLKVPLTLIISQALFVRCGDDVFAFPLAFVEEIRRLKQSDIEEVGGKLLTKVRDVVTEVIRLDAALGLKEFDPVGGHYRLVLVNVGGRQVGIVVEDVLRKDEIVIKNLGEYLRNVKLFPGATIAPDGSLILLVDLNRLVAGESIERRPLMTSATAARIFMPGSTAVAMGEIPDEAIDVVPDEKVVVLADDSISVRKFVGRMLEKAGYRVKLASDGLEALEIVTQGGCDLVVTDLEMPRTNGYELMQHMRQQPETRKIPVMVVTSRAGEKHRERAMKEGARAFLTKPVQEESFIAAIAELIGRGKAMAKVVTAGVGK